MNATFKPVKTIEYTCKQSKYNNVPKLPMRAMICGPSGSGKYILLQSMILEIYKGRFERIFIFSPSIDIDHTWNPVKTSIQDEIRPKDGEKYTLVIIITVTY